MSCQIFRKSAVVKFFFSCSMVLSYAFTGMAVNSRDLEANTRSGSMMIDFGMDYSPASDSTSSILDFRT